MTYNKLAIQETLNIIGGIINKPITVNHINALTVVDKNRVVRDKSKKVVFEGVINDSVDYMEENIGEVLIYDVYPDRNLSLMKNKFDIIFIRK
jgi:hypothetical protein